MTTICLIRHGETDWNKVGRIQGTTDVPLNETGKQQARACGVHLAEEAWDVIVTSPLQRAKQTARIINESLQLPVVEMAQFQEKHFGLAEGLTARERASLYPHKDYPGQEQLNDFDSRLNEGLTELNVRFAGKRVLVVAHGGVIHAILERLAYGDYDGANIRLQNGGFNHLRFSQEQWEIQGFNALDHLELTERMK